MSIVTSSKQISVDLETAVKDFLRQADITVVPARKRKSTITKGAQAKRDREVERRTREHEAKLDARG